jgi:GxxExxY protein
VVYKTLALDCGYRIDVVVEDAVVVELKSVEQVLPIHHAQLLTYLRLSRKQVGLLINFNVAVLKNGIVRRVYERCSPCLRVSVVKRFRNES